MTRRSLVTSLAATAALARTVEAKPHVEWRPRLGVLGPYTPTNVAWAKEAGFTNMILGAGHGSTLDATKISESEIEQVKSNLARSGMHVSAFQITVNHIDSNLERRDRTISYMVKAIDLAGKLGVPYIGTASGKDPALPFPKQIEEIVRVYEQHYFPACQRSQVRLLWEPWPNGPNLATSPVGFSALFDAFHNAPYIGLQYDPSHLVRQFMDPIQTARDFADKIYDVHLKDTEILWPMLRSGGITPVNGQEWWRYRIPGMGVIVWRDFFSVLQDAGYSGAMSIEQEDPLYGGDNNPGPDFNADFKLGFIMAKRYLDQYVP